MTEMAAKETEVTETGEKFPIDYLIHDILVMKAEAWNVGSSKLFYYADYLEKRMLQVKKGEIELNLKDVKSIYGDD